jgi:hypothetical protein
MLTSGPWRLALPRTALVEGEVTLLLRPEKVRLGGEAGSGNSVRGRVIESVYLGASRRVLVEVQGFGVMTVYETGGGDQVVEPGQEVDVTWAVEDAVVLPELHSSGEAGAETPVGTEAAATPDDRDPPQAHQADMSPIRSRRTSGHDG